MLVAHPSIARQLDSLVMGPWERADGPEIDLHRAAWIARRGVWRARPPAPRPSPDRNRPG